MRNTALVLNKLLNNNNWFSVSSFFSLIPVWTLQFYSTSALVLRLRLCLMDELSNFCLLRVHSMFGSVHVVMSNFFLKTHFWWDSVFPYLLKWTTPRRKTHQGLIKRAVNACSEKYYFLLSVYYTQGCVCIFVYLGDSLLVRELGMFVLSSVCPVE